MKRVTYKQRGDDSFMIEIKSKPSRAGKFRRSSRWKNVLNSFGGKGYKESLNYQEGEE
jgi:hypothetical protein